MTAKDINYLLHHLFKNDDHDYLHEQMRVQIGSTLSLFTGSGAQAGAVVELSSYCNTNECLYYKVGPSQSPLYTLRTNSLSYYPAPYLQSKMEQGWFNQAMGSNRF